MDLQTRILPEPYNTVPTSSVHGSEWLPSGSLFPGLTDRRRPAVLPRPTPPLRARHELPAQGRQATRKPWPEVSSWSSPLDPLFLGSAPGVSILDVCDPYRDRATSKIKPRRASPCSILDTIGD